MVRMSQSVLRLYCLKWIVSGEMGKGGESGVDMRQKSFSCQCSLLWDILMVYMIEFEVDQHSARYSKVPVTL